MHPYSSAMNGSIVSAFMKLDYLKSYKIINHWFFLHRIQNEGILKTKDQFLWSQQI